MDTYKQRFTRLQSEIFSLLCIRAGEKINQREIAEALNVSPTAISKALSMGDIIKVKKHGNMNLKEIELDRDKPRAIALKRIENLRLIYESGLAEYLEEKFPGATILLFGSYSLGEDTKNSDIDIAVIKSKSKIMDLARFEKIFEKKINLQVYDSLNRVDKNLRSNIINGIVLSGAIEL